MIVFFKTALSRCEENRLNKKHFFNISSGYKELQVC